MEFHGVYVPLVTPFKDDKVDEPGLRSLVDYLIEGGVDGLIPCGTTGESPTLSLEEHSRVVEIVVQHTNRRVPVVAGAGSNNTHEALELTQHAEKVGADATLQVSPYYNRPGQAGIFAHFKKIAEAASRPIILYNIPKRTGQSIELDTILELAQIPNIVGIKQSGTPLSDTLEIIARLPDFAVFSGDDPLAFSITASGGAGAIAASAHIATADWVEMCRLLRDNKLQAARQLHLRLFPLSKILFIEPNPAPVKAALNLLGQNVGDPRLPILPATQDCKTKLRAVLEDLRLKPSA